MKKKFSFLHLLFKSIFVFTFLAFIGTVVLFFVYGTNLPDYEQLANYKPNISSRFFAKDGSLLTEYATERRIYLELTEIPKNLQNAFLAAEDKNFYTHFGVDLIGISRALLNNIKDKLTGSKGRPQGASTITQQVSKNFFLSSDVSVGRKIKEMILSLKIERTFEKDYILTLYLNKIYLGNYSYGVAAAAHNYFEKSLDQLTLAEVAYLAALPKAPNNYNPFNNKQKALTRRNWVLGQMLKNKFINQEQYNLAIAEDLIVSNKLGVNLSNQAQYFSEEVRKTVAEQFSTDILYQEGFSVFTTMDPFLQRLATSTLKNGILNYDKNHGYRGPLGNIKNISDWKNQIDDFSKPVGTPYSWNIGVVLNVSPEEALVGMASGSQSILPLSNLTWARKQNSKGYLEAEIKAVNSVLSVGDVILVEKNQDGELTLQQEPDVNGAMIIMEPQTGKVLALVGGFAYEKSKFNRATQAQRQVGSIIKPFIYSTALQKDYTPFTIILDAPVVMDRGISEEDGLWKPENYEKTFKGSLTLRSALELSRNATTIRLAQELGMDAIASTFKNFGIYTKDITKNGLAVALGTGEATLINMTSAFASFANGGFKVNPFLIEKVQDRDGKIVYKNDNRICENCTTLTAYSDVIPDIEEDRIRIIDEQTNYQMVSILKGVIDTGSGGRAKVDGAFIAGKTGTTSDYKDAWFIGFTNNLVVGIFIGFDQPKSLGSGGVGGVIAAPIFKEFMTEAIKNYPSTDFKVPEGITFIKLNKTDGTYYDEEKGGKIISEAVKDNQINKIKKYNKVTLDNSDDVDENGNPVVVPKGKGYIRAEQNYNAEVGGVY